jgi:hypothetical protein
MSGRLDGPGYAARHRGSRSVGWHDVAALAGAVLRRPDLWITAVATVSRLARPRWWATRPFLPVPDPDYWGFRIVTAFGGAEGPEGPMPVGAPSRRGCLSSEDVVGYLEWCRRTPAARG